MRLLAATDFALRALMRLAAEPERRMSTEELARELGLSRNHLHKLVQALAAEGLVATQRGAQGGVTLAQPPDQIRIVYIDYSKGQVGDNVVSIPRR